MRSTPALFALAVGALALGLPGLAQATVAVGINTVPVQRLNQDNQAAATHGMPAGTQGLSYADCANDVMIRFTVSMGSLPDPGSYVQVWAGPGDCAPQAARTAATASCWPVTSGNVQQATAQTVDVNVQDMVAQLGLSSTSLNLTYARATKDVCATVASRVSGEATLGVYFVVVPAAGGDGSSVNQPFKVKLAGPAAPSSVSVAAGDGLLNVSWTPAADSTTQGFSVFVDPPRGGTSDAGAKDAGSAAGTCSSSVLTSTANPNDLGAYLATTASGSTNVQATITGLSNGTNYAVAVAARDNYDNVGPLSALTSSSCNVPAPVDDFWAKYRQAGGTAGGNCQASASPGNRGVGVFAAALALACIVVVARRRK